MNLFTGVPPNALFINRLDHNELLGSCSAHEFDLDERHWQTVEHYYQAMKFEGRLKDKICAADNPLMAIKMGRKPFQRKRADWKKIELTVMTRALYTKCKAHPVVAEALLATGSQPLANNAYGDYYWGVGRDGRGSNYYGKILENIRERLISEMSENKINENQ